MQVLFLIVALAASAVVAQTGYADLNITKSAPLLAAPGQAFEYQCVVYNYGPAAARLPRFVDAVPAGLSILRFVSLLVTWRFACAQRRRPVTLWRTPTARWRAG